MKCRDCNIRESSHGVRCNRCYYLIPKNREKRRIRNKQYQNANKEKRRKIARKHWLIQRYNLTPDGYNFLLHEQDNRCAICGVKQAEVKYPQQHTLCVDHDHKTGMVRGLLCRRCNTGLGNFLDNPEFLQRAHDYIL